MYKSTHSGQGAVSCGGCPSPWGLPVFLAHGQQQMNDPSPPAPCILMGTQARARILFKYNKGHFR